MPMVQDLHAVNADGGPVARGRVLDWLILVRITARIRRPLIRQTPKQTSSRQPNPSPSAIGKRSAYDKKTCAIVSCIVLSCT